MWRSILDFARIDDIFTFKSNDLELFKKYIILSLGGFVQIINNYLFPDVKYSLDC